MSSQVSKLIGVLLLLALPTTEVLSADEEKDEDARRCINGSVMRSTKIIDDSRILFYIRSNSIYLNVLPRRCNGLAREGRFSYRRTSSQLCRNDSINVLLSSAGGLREGRSCGLGYFYAVTRVDVELLLEGPPPPPPGEPLPSADPEEIIEQSDETLSIRG